VRPLILTPGDPNGIGPEVALAALRSFNRRPVVVVGAAEPLLRLGGDAVRLVSELTASAEAISVFEPGDDGQPVELTSIHVAVAACLDGRAGGLVTGPIHKGRLSRAGSRWLGHTELLGHLCGVERPVMAFVGGAVRVALVTVHLPLRAVPDAVTTPLVLHTITLADRALRDDLRLARRRIAVCGLNPHAGDDGALGHEDAAVIAPAVNAAIAAGVDAWGPVSAETAFLAAVRGDCDLVVAAYHDQGLAPLKALDFGRSVNWTLGLPIIRTSVDHGTADDLVGTGRADPSSMLAALHLAADLADRREA
jgi:4-hydroxythreonine-4-phosphate dehydrogenase